jgi:hypothetical protein
MVPEASILFFFQEKGLVTMAVSLCNFCSSFKEMHDNRICKDCLEEYVVVKSYVEKNPTAPVMIISNDLNINFKKIMKFVEQGRFILVEQDKSIKKGNSRR